VKRLPPAVLACRDNGFSEDAARDAVLNCVRSYRQHMAEYSDMPVLDVWYASIDVEQLIPTIADKEARKRMKKRLEKAHERSVLEHDFPQLATTAGLAPAIKDNPPLIFHPLETGHEELMANVKNTLHATETMRKTGDFCWTVPTPGRAMKVVGVSVGTYCAILP
jgi:hypothetical protein